MSQTVMDAESEGEAGVPRSAADGATAVGRVIDFDADEFRALFNERHFVVAHRLANHPAFDLHRLVELAGETARTRPKDVYYDVGKVQVGERWRDVPRGSLPVEETVRNLETQDAWIFLRSAERHPAYAPMLDRAMSDILELTGVEMSRRIMIREVILFITSPRRVATYHIDRECNFLLQIRGEKDVSVFSKDDREVLSEAEIETFWAADSNAPRYRPHLEPRADRIRLRPGLGVHIPVNAPHWTQNLDDVSVSASFNFQFCDSVRANMYRANYYMRKLGLRPSPPFRGRASDLAKAAMGGAVYNAREALRRRRTP